MILYCFKSKSSDECIKTAFADYCIEMGIKPYIPLILREGKPKIKGFEFNLSHSHNMTIVGFSNKPIGVDIEFKSGKNLDKIKSYLNLQNKTDDEFYVEWTKREAVLKMTGEGISKIRNFDYAYPVTTLENFDGYTISICGDSDIKIKRLYS